MFEELYKFISRLHYGIKFMPEKDFDELFISVRLGAKRCMHCALDICKRGEKS